MNKLEFIKMCYRDSGDNEILNEIVKLFEEVIPFDFDVDCNKNPQDFYKFMYDYAFNNKKENSYVISFPKAKELVYEYFGINKYI